MTRHITADELDASPTGALAVSDDCVWRHAGDGIWDHLSAADEPRWNSRDSLQLAIVGARLIDDSGRDAPDTTALDLEPGRWWRVLRPNDEVTCETSRESEARLAVRPGDRLEQQYLATIQEWREEPTGDDRG